LSPSSALLGFAARRVEISVMTLSIVERGFKKIKALSSEPTGPFFSLNSTDFW
jgi:hypothetical protein